jgi:hypothetical protein
VAIEANRTVRINFVGEDKGVGDTVSGIKGQLIAVAAVAAAATKALDALGDETARLDKIAKGAQQTGLGFDAYQRLAQVSKLAGTNVDTLAKGTIRLTRNLNDLASGRGAKVADNLERLGLTLEDLQDSSPTEQLAVLSDALAGVESDAQKTAIAVELFGRSGAELIPLLNAGSDAILELESSVGKVFTREELARAEAYQDALANLEKASSDLAGTIAVEAAPAIQGLVEDATASARALGESREFAEGLELAVGRLEAIVGPAAATVGFFTDQLSVLANVANLVVDELDSASDQIVDALEETEAAKWARETAREFDNLGGGAVRRLTDAIADQLPEVDGLKDRWSLLKNTILNTSADQGKFLTGGQKLLGGLLTEARAVSKEQEQIAKTAAAAAEEVEETHRRTGARGPTAAERTQAAGVIIIDQWRQRLDLMEVGAKLAGTTADSALEFGRIRTNIAVQELELERQVLAATRARGALERERVGARLAAIDGEIELIEKRREVKEREAADALVAAAVIETAKASEEEQRIEAERIEAERQARVTAEEEKLTAFERESQLMMARGQLVESFAEKQLLLQAQVAAAEGNHEQARELRHRAEVARLRDELKARQQMTAGVSSMLRTGQQLSSVITGAVIKDEEKRAQAELKSRGIMAIATGALETVKAAASFASFNVVQGALHTAAATLAFAQGGIMLAGNVPGRGSAGGGASAAATAPRADRETGEAAQIVESLPAADREPPRQPSPGQGGGGNVTNIENLNVTGAIDDQTIEAVRLGLDNVDNGLEAAG